MKTFLLILAFILFPLNMVHATAPDAFGPSVHFVKSNQFQTFPAWQTQPPKIPNKVVNKNPPKPIVVPKKGK